MYHSLTASEVRKKIDEELTIHKHRQNERTLKLREDIDHIIWEYITSRMSMGDFEVICCDVLFPNYQKVSGIIPAVISKLEADGFTVELIHGTTPLLRISWKVVDKQD